MSIALPKRSEIDPKYTFDLESIFSSKDDWEDAVRKVESSLQELEKFKGHLADSPQKLLDWFKTMQEASIRMRQVFVYASLLFDTDTGNQDAAALRDRARSLF